MNLLIYKSFSDKTPNCKEIYFSKIDGLVALKLEELPKNKESLQKKIIELKKNHKLKNLEFQQDDFLKLFIYPNLSLLDIEFFDTLDPDDDDEVGSLLSTKKIKLLQSKIGSNPYYYAIKKIKLRETENMLNIILNKECQIEIIPTIKDLKEKEIIDTLFNKLKSIL